MVSSCVKTDISTLKDVQLVVDTFYGKVRNDDLLATIFNDVIQDNWPTHLEKMYRFWSTVLLDDKSYKGAPFVPHAKLDVYQEHFERWLLLFFSTVDSLFSGEKAEKAKWQGERMAEMFLLKIEFIRENNFDFN
jgi:hemoglobin